jgi:hypothetical protein
LHNSRIEAFTAPSCHPNGALFSVNEPSQSCELLPVMRRGRATCCLSSAVTENAKRADQILHGRRDSYSLSITIEHREHVALERPRPLVEWHLVTTSS